MGILILINIGSSEYLFVGVGCYEYVKENFERDEMLSVGI